MRMIRVLRVTSRGTCNGSYELFRSEDDERVRQMLVVRVTATSRCTDSRILSITTGLTGSGHTGQRILKI